MYNPFSLEGKTIVVTGASSGIGRQCAIDCSRMGAKVALVARNRERLEETLGMLESPRDHSCYICDLSAECVVESVVRDIVSVHGPISGVINCAGISSVALLKMIKEETFDRFFRTNVFSALNLTKEISRKGNFLKEGCSVIFIGSIMGCVGEKGKTLYSATKGALVSAARSLACELAGKKIRVNVVSPGAIVTPINKDQSYMSDPDLRSALVEKHPLGLGDVTDVSQTCVFLLSDASRWITGQSIIVDGGYTAI